MFICNEWHLNTEEEVHHRKLKVILRCDETAAVACSHELLADGGLTPLLEAQELAIVRTVQDIFLVIFVDAVHNGWKTIYGRAGGAACRDAIAAWLATNSMLRRSGRGGASRQP